MLVKHLKPGETFSVDIFREKLRYKLIYANECRAYVEPIGARKKNMDPLDENEKRAGGRVNISPDTECLVDWEDFPDDSNDDFLEENDDFMGTTKNTNGQAAAPAKKKTRGTGYRHCDPTKQERPIKEGTIRANLMNSIKAGENTIPKLMKKFGMAKPLLYSHINDFNRANGYGYTIENDLVTIIKPIGGELKAKPAASTQSSETKESKKGKTASKKKAEKAEKDPLDDDDDFLS
jgi:hypothetical protein